MQKKLISNVNLNDWSTISNADRQHKNKCITIKTGPLYVDQVLQTGITLPDKTTIRHIYEEKGIFTKPDAINISVKRDSTYNLNTVFAKPNYFKKCKTDDSENPTLMISSHRVQAYQCVRNDNGKWKAHDLGKVYAIFTMDRSHFPGYLYKSVKWP